jgi:hypothetical protein
MEFPIPEPLKVEHAELHAELVEATKAGGRVGEAAREVAKRLHPHFVREEEFALPPLGLLASLAKEAVSPDMAGVLALTSKLEAELPGMLAEHKEIGPPRTRCRGGRREQAEACALRRKADPAQTKGEVLYPAALLVGRYLKLKLGN